MDCWSVLRPNTTAHSFLTAFAVINYKIYLLIFKITTMQKKNNKSS